MKNIIRKLLKKIGFPIPTYLTYCYRYDEKRFDMVDNNESKEHKKYAAQIRIIVHTIEKAFSLSDCRDDFGRGKIITLINLLESYDPQKGKDEEAVVLANSIINKYYNHRVEKRLSVDFIPTQYRKDPHTQIKTGAQEFYHISNFSSFEQFARSRHSIRNFSSRSIDKERIVTAVKIAQTSPSACNRQATRVYACLDPEKIGILKNSHGGIKSFGQPGFIIAIAQDMTMYLNEYERNTWLIDAGIFCMNLLYALHSEDFGCCPVIWGGMEDEDTRIMELLGIPASERVAILIVGGNIGAECKTPVSSKRQVNEILSFC